MNPTRAGLFEKKSNVKFLNVQPVLYTKCTATLRKLKFNWIDESKISSYLYSMFSLFFMTKDFDDIAL
jgi:hypothetical protein